jgi:hypothetical protein
MKANFNVKLVFQALWRSVKNLTSPELWGWLLLSVGVVLGALMLLAMADQIGLSGNFLQQNWYLVLESKIILLKETGEIELQKWMWLRGLIIFMSWWVEWWFWIVLPMFYGVIMIMVATFILPRLLQKIAARQYPSLILLDKKNSRTSLRSRLLAVFILTASWQLPMLSGYFGNSLEKIFPEPLFGGLFLLLLILPLALFNRWLFTSDCLVAHATEAERQTILRSHAKPLLILGMISFLLFFVPVAGILLAPCFMAMAYIHYCLEALSQLRNGLNITTTNHE